MWPSFSVTVLAAALVAWPSGIHAEPYIISSSPSLPRQLSEQAFLPLVELLTRTTGGEFIYEYAGNWPGYVKNMRQSRYHVMFDEPHLVGWRVEHLNHVPLIKLSGTLKFVIITRHDDDAIVQLDDLAGHRVCGRVAPGMDSLILFSQFQNPSRQPYLMPVHDAEDGYRNLLQEKCRGAVLRSRLYDRLSGGGRETQILFLSKPFSNWALSADSVVPLDTRDQIKRVILDPGNRGVTSRLRGILATQHEIQSTEGPEYAGYGDLLRDFWGFQ